MKWKLTTLNICFAYSAFLANPVTAGLHISDSPMFVTDVLAPNVMIVPVEYFYANEVSMKNPPLGTIRLCTTMAGKKTCPDIKFSSGNFNNLVGNVDWHNLLETGTKLSKILTPWPGFTSCQSYDAGYTDVTFSCSINDVYGQYTSGGVTDLVNFNNDTFGSIKNASFRTYGSHELSYEGLKYFDDNPVYKERLVATKQIDPARMAYLRSNENFLYFNPDLLYKPWKNLGSSNVFNGYASNTAAQPVYNPLAAFNVDISSIGSARFTEGNTWSGDGRGYVAPYLIGQYHVFRRNDPNCVPNGVKQVWFESCYDRYTWDGVDVAGSAASDSAYNFAIDGVTIYQKYASTQAFTPERKINFANWFTYWRNSYLATRGMISLFVDNLGPNGADIFQKLRIGMAGESGVLLKPKDVARNAIDARMLDIANIIYNPSYKFGSYKHWVSTEYFTGSNNANMAYRDDPDSASSPLRSCRRNYEVVLTSDYMSMIGVGSTGYVKRTNQDNVKYRYGDVDKDGITNSDTFGDAGFYGWNTDLSDLANNLLPSKVDSKTSQHLVRYLIGPSVQGTIFSSPPSDYSAAMDLLNKPARPAWKDPSTASALSEDSVDDLWHMVLNSRGFFYPSDNVITAQASLLNAFNDILVRSVSGSAVATNTSSLSGGGKIYKATVENDWKGHLRAYRVTPNQAQTFLEIEYGTFLWDLAEGVSTQADGSGWGTVRKIVTYNGGGVPFRWDDIGVTAKSLLKTAVPTGVTDADAYGEKMLEYLRGSGDCEDGHLEATNADCTSGVAYTFRRRNIDRSQTGPYSSNNSNGRNVLGDISNSSPWPVSPPAAGRSDVDFPGYNAFRVAQKSRLNVLYVGANDGMLHAVDASDGDDKGKELFAYIPSFVQTNLHELAGAGYAHKFFVDGSPFSADVDLGGWKTVLAGGANKGGKGYYLLDVTDPVKDTETEVADMVKWEFTHPRDLHYTFNLPVADSHGQARQIVRMNDEKLALIVGNGYPELSGKKACLFILYLSGPGADAGDAAGVDYHGAGYHKLCAGADTYAADGGLDTNGLSTPTPVDLDGDGKVDVIYAGDLNGNMWRFNVPTTVVTTTTEVDGSPVTTNEYTNHWAVVSTDPIFVAKNAAGVRQPIITPPELALHTVGSTSGPLVLFGTGKYIESSDRANTDVQSFYGVWDRGITAITRNNLFSQTFKLDTSLSPNIRKQTTKPTFSYCTAASLVDCPNVIPAVTDPLTLPSDTNRYMGWYWDMLTPEMPTPGERLTGKMSLINGVILFNTFYPATETYSCVVNEVASTCTRLDPCQYGGDGWRMGLNAVNGYMEDQFPVFDVNQDGVVDSSGDALAAGIKMGAEMGGVTYAKGIGNTYVGIGAATNVSNTGTEKPPTIDVGTAGSGRVSWFELLD